MIVKSCIVREINIVKVKTFNTYNSGEKVALPDAVRNCLSIMNCCGVNDYSGEFMFEVRKFSDAPFL